MATLALVWCYVTCCPLGNYLHIRMIFVTGKYQIWRVTLWLRHEVGFQTKILVVYWDRGPRDSTPEEEENMEKLLLFGWEGKGWAKKNLTKLIIFLKSLYIIKNPQSRDFCLIHFWRKIQNDHHLPNFHCSESCKSLNNSQWCRSYHINLWMDDFLLYRVISKR